MMREELCQFFGAHIDAPPGRLWWQSADGLHPLSEAVHVRTAKEIRIGKAAPEYSAMHDVTWNDGSIEGRPEKFAALVESMAQDGWKGPRVKIAINDRGQLVITDGLHRSATAFVLGLTVPCEIVYRHEKWIALKYSLFELNGGVKLYQPIAHPDLAWPSWRRDTALRANIIASWLRANEPGAHYGVDLACNSGSLTCALGRAGYSMKGLDTSESAVRAASILASMEGIGSENATFARCDEMPSIPKSYFAVCLSLLNHHQVDGRSAEGQEIFRRLVGSAPVVFLDAPVSGDPVGGDSPFVDPDNVLAWCKESGAPGQGQVIDTAGALMRPLLVWSQ